MNVLKPVCAAALAAVVVFFGGCMGSTPEPIRAVPMAEAGQALPPESRDSLRIDLADQETEGFHFLAPMTAGTQIDRWELYYAPAASAEAGPDGLPVAPPALMPLSEFGPRHFLRAQLYDCLTVNNPLSSSLGGSVARQHVPDALIPMTALANGFRSVLEPGDRRANRHIWVELSWQVDATQGAEDPSRILRGRHGFRARGLDAAGALLVDVGFSAEFHDFTLPVQGRFRTMINWNTSIEGFYGKPVLTLEMRRAYYDFFLRHRLSPTSFHKQEMEPSLADLPYCAARGQNSINLYTIGRQKGMLPQVETDKIKQIGSGAQEALAQAGLSESAFVLVCNSTEQSDLDSINTNADSVHAEMPWAKVWLFATPNEGLSHRINAWTTLTAADTRAFQSVSYNKEMREKFAGQQDLNLWFVGQEPGSPYANLLLSNRAGDAQVLALQTWANNISGLVVPHATAWPWNGAARAAFPAQEWQARRDGLGVLCYPLPSGQPCPSARLVNLRDGLEHAEALRTAEFLVYNLDIYNKLFQKITLPLLEENLRHFDNVGQTEDMEKRLTAKLALSREQQARIPAQLAALTTLLAEYRERFGAIDQPTDDEQNAAAMTLRRRLYRVIDNAEPLMRAITENLNDPLVPKEKPAEMPMPGEAAPQG